MPGEYIILSCPITFTISLQSISHTAKTLSISSRKENFGKDFQPLPILQDEPLPTPPTTSQYPAKAD